MRIDAWGVRLRSRAKSIDLLARRLFGGRQIRREARPLSTPANLRPSDEAGLRVTIARLERRPHVRQWTDGERMDSDRAQANQSANRCGLARMLSAATAKTRSGSDKETPATSGP